MILEFLTPERITLITLLITQTVTLVQLHFSRKDKKNDQRSQLEKQAADTLTSLVGMLQSEVKNKNVTDREKDTEIEELEGCLKTIKEKLKQAHLDVLDLRYAVRKIRRFLTEQNIEDEHIKQTLDDLEAQLKNIGDCLK